LTTPQGFDLIIIDDPLTFGGSIGPWSLHRASEHGQGFYCFRRGPSRGPER